MKTVKNKINPKELLLSLLLANFSYGFVVLFMINSFNEIIINGLYHKILLGFPIGFVFMIIISSMFAIITYLIIILNIEVFKKYELREKSLNLKGENNE